jgi:hypothetical protein
MRDGDDLLPESALDRAQQEQGKCRGSHSHHGDCLVRDVHMQQAQQKRKQGNCAEEGKGQKHHKTVLQETHVVFIWQLQSQFLRHHQVHEEFLVLGHLLDHNLRVRCGHASLAEEQDHLLDLSLLVVLVLPLLATLLGEHEVSVGLAAEVLPSSHCQTHTHTDDMSKLYNKNIEIADNLLASASANTLDNPKINTISQSKPPPVIALLEYTGQ